MPDNRRHLRTSPHPGAGSRRFGKFDNLLRGKTPDEAQGDPLIFHLQPDSGLEIADPTWNNEQGWTLAARVRDPLNQSGLYLGAAALLQLL